jgi:hypothetical protein
MRLGHREFLELEYKELYFKHYASLEEQIEITDHRALLAAPNRSWLTWPTTPIANSRIREIDEATGKVTITYRDYADGAQIKLLKLSSTEFIRRFSLHLLPPRFTKIRHYGILGNNRKSIAIPTVCLLLHSLATVRLLLALARRPTNAVPVGCTRCHIGQMRLFALFTLRGAFRAGPPLLDSS